VTISPLGLKNLIGVQGASNYTCSWTANDIAGGTHTGTASGVIVDGQIISSNSSGGFYGQAYVNNAVNNYSGNPNSFCPNQVSLSGVTISGYTTGTSEDSTGVFEYKNVITALGALIITLVIIMRGIALVKKGILAVNEETSEEDALEYYIGPNGREYYRVKNKARGYY